MKGQRERELGTYIVQTGATVRAAAEKFGVSKSTVHADVTVRLKNSDFCLWEEVAEVLAYNKAQRHIRGGMATKEKYRKKVTAD